MSKLLQYSLRSGVREAFYRYNMSLCDNGSSFSERLQADLDSDIYSEIMEEAYMGSGQGMKALRNFMESHNLRPLSRDPGWLNFGCCFCSASSRGVVVITMNCEFHCFGLSDPDAFEKALRIVLNAQARQVPNHVS